MHITFWDLWSLIMYCSTLKWAFLHNVQFYCLHCKDVFQVICVYSYLSNVFLCICMLLLLKLSSRALIPYIGDIVYCLYLSNQFGERSVIIKIL